MECVIQGKREMNRPMRNFRSGRAGDPERGELRPCSDGDSDSDAGLRAYVTWERL